MTSGEIVSGELEEGLRGVAVPVKRGDDGGRRAA